MRRAFGARGLDAVAPPCSIASHAHGATAVLPQGVPRVAVEAGVTAFWRQYVGLEGGVVGIDRFGESAPAPALFEHFGLTSQAVVEARARASLKIRRLRP